MAQESTRVAYTGTPRDGVGLGDEGVVLAVDGPVVHVKWTTGARTHDIVPVYEHDLAASSILVAAALGHDGLDDSLEVGSMMAFSARRVYDQGGEVGLVNAMAEQGHLASFAEIAEEALALVSSRVRTDPVIAASLASLDDAEREDVVRLASTCLIRDAFTAEED